jgi:hypothetical protein
MWLTKKLFRRKNRSRANDLERLQKWANAAGLALNYTSGVSEPFGKLIYIHIIGLLEDNELIGEAPVFTFGDTAEEAAKNMIEKIKGSRVEKKNGRLYLCKK